LHDQGVAFGDNNNRHYDDLFSSVLFPHSIPSFTAASSIRIMSIVMTRNISIIFIAM